MINYYQPWLLPFLKSSKTKLKDGINRSYYHSFEDGLWDLLVKKNIPKNKVILIPDFYCADVLQNIRNHGYKYVLYPLDRDFQISKDMFALLIKKFEPSVVIIFHACGISSDLISETKWTRHLNRHSLILEDCVHKLLNPGDLTLISENHFIMDSLRKVSPLPGSVMYGTEKGMDFPKPRFNLFSYYFISSFDLFLWFRFVFVTGVILNLPGLTKWAHLYLLKKHDDIIGDCEKPHSGFSLFLKLADRFDFQKIEKLKLKQVKLYEEKLDNIFGKSGFYKIKIPKADRQKLHVYPLGVRHKPDSGLENCLHKKGIIAWFKYPESAWSRRRSVLFLPLGFHISPKDISYISKTIYSCRNSSSGLGIT